VTWIQSLLWTIWKVLWVLRSLTWSTVHRLSQVLAQQVYRGDSIGGSIADTMVKFVRARVTNGSTFGTPCSYKLYHCICDRISSHLYRSPATILLLESPIESPLLLVLTWWLFDPYWISNRISLLVKSTSLTFDDISFNCNDILQFCIILEGIDCLLNLGCEVHCSSCVVAKYITDQKTVYKLEGCRKLLVKAPCPRSGGDECYLSYWSLDQRNLVSISYSLSSSAGKTSSVQGAVDKVCWTFLRSCSCTHIILLKGLRRELWYG
jgi:hypothetical protein